MPILAFVFLLISSIFLGIMSIVRKEYQVKNGTTMTATIFFTLFISAIGFGLGGFVNGGISFDLYGYIIAGVYAIISTVTASICIYGTAFGNVSTLVVWAMLGNLVLPSVFGLIAQPDDNKLTVYKILGFIMAAICMIINFVVDKSEEKESRRFKLLCAVVFVTNGLALIVFNLKTRYCQEVEDIEFIAYYMLLSAVITAITLCLMRLKTKDVTNVIKKSLNKKSVILMLLYAGMFLISEVLALNCANLLPLTVQSPISFSIPIITTAIIDYIVYKAALNKMALAQMLFAGLCCVSFMLEG